MALTLTKETGAGMSNANSYASVADGDDYHDGHLYASAWTGAATEQKEAALVMASMLIDSHFEFAGWRAIPAQALGWPRWEAPDKEFGGYLSVSAVPTAVVRATCEQARALLVADRTLPPDGEGLKYENDGTGQKGFDKTDTPEVLTRVVLMMLAPFGRGVGARSGAVSLVRV